MAISLPPKFTTIPDFAADLRSNLDKTQQEIAELIGKPRTHISKYENGKMFPPAGYLAYLICLNLEVLQNVRTIKIYKETSLKEMNQALREYPRVPLLRGWGELAQLAKDYIHESKNRCNPETPSPYRGLSAFRQEDYHLFFGRATFIQSLLRSIENRCLITVSGASGSGKSSVVFAGLLPALLNRPNEKWLYAAFRPGQDPFAEASNALTPLLEADLDPTKQITAASNLASSLCKRELSLTGCLLKVQRMHPDHRLLLIIDQFEELFTLTHDTAIREQFFDALWEIVQTIQGSSPRLVLTLRADFLGQAHAYRPLADALQMTVQSLGPMNRDELREVIEKPATLHNLAFEAKLVDRLLDDVGQEAGKLPLLEFALNELWQRQRQHTLTHLAYAEIGQIQGALGSYADDIYESLSPAKQAQAQRLFVQLVNPGDGMEDTRRRATRSELEAEWPLVTELATKRLVVTDHATHAHESETVELVHETLIRHWARLQQWIEEARLFRVWQERLRFSLAQWQADAQGEELLLRGSLLTEAERWLVERGEEIGQVERDFIRSSVALRDRERMRKKKEGYLRWSALVVSTSLFGLLLWLGAPSFRSWWLTQCLPHCPNKSLAGLDLTGANLHKADLGGSDLSSAILRRADLSEATLGHANLSQTDLEGAALWGADLRGANLSGANLNDADLNWADLAEAKIDDMTKIVDKWRRVWEIVTQNAEGRNLIEADLRNANLHEANLKNADLRNADLHGATLWGANLHGANLHGADLSKADLNWANLNFAKIDETTAIDEKWRLVWEIVNHSRTGRDLQGVDLSKAELHQVQLSEANLYKANLHEAHLWGALLINADLREANLHKAELPWAILDFSQLNGADLRGANLNGAKLEKADLTNALYDDATIWPKGVDPEAAGARASE